MGWSMVVEFRHSGRAAIHSFDSVADVPETNEGPREWFDLVLSDFRIFQLGLLQRVASGVEP